MALELKNYDPAVMYGATDTAPDQISLADAHILVGDATGNAADVALSGDATMANTGAITIASNAVTTAKIIDGAVTLAKVNYAVSPKAAVVANAASANLAVADAGKNITNTGAGAPIVLTLPAAATAVNKAWRIQVTVAQTVTLTPAAGEKVYLGGSGVASKYALIAGVVGNYVDLFCDGTDYLITGYSGVVTKEG